MARALRRAPFLGLFVLFLSCNQNYPNPFVAQQTTKLPAATDDISFTSDLYNGTPNGLLEAYSLDSSTGAVTRLTFCNSPTIPCNNIDASFAPDRRRVAIGQVTQDTNGDGLLTAADGEALVYEDLARGVSAALVPNTAHVEGFDWSPADGLIAYSASGPGGNEDLYSIGTDGTNNQDLSNTPSIRERRPRFDRTGSVVAIERIAPPGKGEAYVYDTAGQEDLVDAGAAGTAVLPGTPYVVGADADPTFAPDGSAILFRRLTSVAGTSGTWDLMSVGGAGTHLVTIATGPSYRGAPDWGPNGIIFVESDPSLQSSSIVLVTANGTGRRTLYTAPAGITLASPRWLPPVTP
jgi:Tol biopolymer transport system component